MNRQTGGAPMEFQPKRILVAVDFSECSSEALRLATEIADKFSCALTVLHAAPASSDTEASRQEHDERTTAIENEFILFIRSVLGRKPLPDYRILEMQPTEAILFAAKYEKVELIVLGTRGRGGLSRLTLGSVAERVLRLSTVPVLTICTGRSKRRGVTIRRILCPVNYSSAAGRAFETAVSFAEKFDAELLVLHLIEGKPSAADLASEKERLGVWTRDILPRSARTTPLVMSGNAAAEILQYAAENQIDLIVVAGWRERFSDETVFGSTTEQVTRHAPCAVLTVTSTSRQKAEGRRQK